MKATKANVVAACLRVLENATVPHCAYMLRNKIKQKGYGGLHSDAESIHHWMQQQAQSGAVKAELHQDMPPHGDMEWRYSIIPEPPND